MLNSEELGREVSRAVSQQIVNSRRARSTRTSSQRVSVLAASSNLNYVISLIVQKDSSFVVLDSNYCISTTNHQFSAPSIIIRMDWQPVSLNCSEDLGLRRRFQCGSLTERTRSKGCFAAVVRRP